MEGVINTDFNMGGQGIPNIFHDGGLSIHFTRGCGLVIQTDFSMRGGGQSFQYIQYINTIHTITSWDGVRVIHKDFNMGGEWLSLQILPWGHGSP